MYIGIGYDVSNCIHGQFVDVSSEDYLIVFLFFAKALGFRRQRWRDCNGKRARKLCATGPDGLCPVRSETENSNATRACDRQSYALRLMFDVRLRQSLQELSGWGKTGTAGGPRFSLLATLWGARRLRAESRLAPAAPGTVVLEKKRAEPEKHQRGKLGPEVEPSRACLQSFHLTRTPCNSQPRNAPWAVRLFPGICELSP